MLALLPAIVLFIVVALILVAVFSLISFVYFRIKRRKSLNQLAKSFSPNDNVDDPYIEMTSLKSNRTKQRDDYDVEFPEQKTIPKPNIKLNKIKNTRKNSISIQIPQINNSKNLGISDNGDPESTEKFQYVSKLIKYTKQGIQLFTSELVNIASSKVFKNLAWQTTFQSQPIIQHTLYPTSSPNFPDLLDIFKLEPGQYKFVKFVVQVLIKNCSNKKVYYLQDLPKTQRVEQISSSEYESTKRILQKE